MRGSPADMGEQPKEEGCTGGGRMALPGSTYGPSPGAAIGAAPVATSGTYSGTYSGATSGTHSGTYSGTYSGATSGATSGTTSDAGDEPTTTAAAAAPSDPASASADIFVRGAGPVCMGSGLWRELVRWRRLGPVLTPWPRNFPLSNHCDFYLKRSIFAPPSEMRELWWLDPGHRPYPTTLPSRLADYLARSHISGSTRGRVLTH